MDVNAGSMECCTGAPGVMVERLCRGWSEIMSALRVSSEKSGLALGLLGLPECLVGGHPVRGKYVEPGCPGRVEDQRVVVDEHGDGAVAGEPAQRLDLHHACGPVVALRSEHQL